MKFFLLKMYLKLFHLLSSFVLKHLVKHKLIFTNFLQNTMLFSYFFPSKCIYHFFISSAILISKIQSETLLIFTDFVCRLYCHLVTFSPQNLLSLFHHFNSFALKIVQLIFLVRLLDNHKKKKSMSYFEGV